MKNIKIFTRSIMICVLLASLMLIAFSACTNGNDEPAPAESGQNQTNDGNDAEDSKQDEAPEPEEPEQIRVFENGNANIKLFPNGTFIANLFHSTKITGTYTEMTQGNETAVLFTYNGVTAVTDGVSSFDADGSVTAVGGIMDNILTAPEDWEDGHGHGLDYTYRAYPLVFADGGGQTITLYADNTFAADFANDVKIIGYYGIRSASVTFVPGSPAFNNSGELAGTALLAGLTTVGSDHDDHSHTHDDDEHEHHHDDEEDDHHGEHEHDGSHDNDAAVILELPELWLEISGGGTFALQ